MRVSATNLFRRYLAVVDDIAPTCILAHCKEVPYPHLCAQIGLAVVTGELEIITGRQCSHLE